MILLVVFVFEIINNIGSCFDFRYFICLVTILLKCLVVMVISL